jgi:hypothetical protein
MRMAGDVSADADPGTGLAVYASEIGGWLVVGGTSAAAPIVAGSLTALGVANGHFTPAWVWQNPQAFFDVTSGSNGTCGGQASYVCNAGSGYDGPTGWGTPDGAAILTGSPPGPDWAAQFVGQSFPYATGAALTMTEGQTIPSYIELKNTGKKTWDSNTLLGTTQPHDRASVFTDGTWVAPNRLARVTGTVPPGGTYKFQFDLHAPRMDGTFTEYFNVVEEQVAWFSDPGQGGPADDFLAAQITVIAPQYRGDFKDQSFPVAPAPLTAHVGDVLTGYVELTNSGTQPWKAGTTKLAPTPRDKPSAFADSSWLSPTRVSTLAADVAPGATGRFAVKLDAAAAGDTTVTFALVEESVTWFADAPLGGGPSDTQLAVHLVVLPKDAPMDAGGVLPGDGGQPAHVDGGLRDGGVAPAPPGNEGVGATADAGGSTGCSVAVERRPSGGLPFGIFASALGWIVVALRRRARH